jgi:hypothetical protein
MSAKSVARGLDHRARREGRNWRTRCPIHNGRSLCLADGRDGHLLVKCWAGCNPLDVLAELRRRELLDDRNPDQTAVSPERRENDTERDTKRTAWALDGIWREARWISSTPVEPYLKSRSIDLHALPAEAQISLRFHSRCPRPRDEHGYRQTPLPAMVCLVQHVKRGPVAVSCTYLRPDGSAKADIPKNDQKAFFGPVGGGAVHFGEPRKDQWLVLGEGIESTLSVVQPCRLPGWACLSAGGLRSIVLPPEARLVLICADHDRNGVGQRAASEAAQRFLAEGRRVKLALPPQTGTDFNDVLAGNAASREVRDVT